MDQKIDLVYILTNASKWQNNEIRYSLRSVEKNLNMQIGKIFIVGYLPKFIETKEVWHIDTQDFYTNKLRNAVRKIKAACNDQRVSDRFILMNDDFFIMKKTDEIKYWIKGTLARAMRKYKAYKGYYYNAIRDTKNLLESMGIENPMDFEIHAPIIIEKKRFLDIDRKLDLESKRGLVFRSIYGNLNHIKGEIVPDVKIYGKQANKLDNFKNYNIISTDNKIVLDSKFQKWIGRKFKDISKYEKEKIGVYYSKTMFTYAGVTYNPGDVIRVGQLPEIIVKKNNLTLVKKSY
jgi:hypothetical protein